MMAILSIYWGFAAEVDYSRTKFYVNCAKKVSGDGTSWKNALSTDKFIEVLKKAKPGSTFYLAKGEYISSATNIENTSAFWGNGGVTIRGGYAPTDGSDGYSPKNQTTITVTNGQRGIMSLPMTPNYPTEVYDINFKGMATSGGLACNVTMASGNADENSFFRFERCTFTQNAGIDMFTPTGNGIFYQCDFDFTQGGNAHFGLQSGNLGSKKNKITFSCCSFSGGNTCIDFHLKYDLKIINCTFGGNDGIYTATNLINAQNTHAEDEPVNNNGPLVELIHNTILGGVRIAGMKSFLNGNYIHGELSADMRGYEPSYNAFVSSVNTDFLKFGDILIDYDQIPIFFPFMNATYTFVKKPGKLTKTIELLTDYYYENEYQSILFRNQEETFTETDQIGQERYEFPCFGAYELKFNKHMNYYVKSTGTGDGSSWKHAMGIDRFSYLFKIAPSGSTFHFAEGVYTPTSLSSPDGFTTQQCVNLQGGYSLNPKEGEIPKPEAHKTIFNADLKENVDFSDGGLGDLPDVLKYEPNKSGTIKISGITFTRQSNDPKDHYRGALMINTPNDPTKLTFVVENCSFENNNNAVYIASYNPSYNPSKHPSNHPTIKFRKCHFEDSRVYALYTSGCNKIEVESCTFRRNGTAIMSSPQEVKISNSTFTENSNTLDISPVDTSIITITNNTIMGGIKIWMAKESDISFVGNIITGPNISSDNLVNKSTNNLFIYEDESTMEIPWNSTWDKSMDQFTTMEDLFTVIDYKYDVNWEKIPSISYERGSFVIPLQSDKTRDGINLRFPLEKTSVERDQRGVRREKLTCVGAYEYPGDYPYIPDAFTPYSTNGKNDIFMKGYEVYIYNRYGSLLCHSTKGWDGYYKGKLVEPGVYIYVVTTNAGSWKGTVEVIKSM